MANQDAPFGLTPISRSGSNYVGSINRYHIAVGNATGMGVGDPVVSSGTADADGVPGIARAAAGDAIRGVIVGFDFLNRDQEDLPQYRPASVECYAMVADDPNMRVLVQEDSVTSTLAATDVGLNANFIVAAASSVTGRSQVEIDSDSAATTNTLPLKILELYQADDNVIGDNAKWVCSLNTSELKGDTGSTGI
jgi:hypothetical protein